MRFHNAIARNTKDIFTNPELLAEGQAAMTDRARGYLAHRCKQIKNHTDAEHTDISTPGTSIHSYKVLSEVSVALAVYREGEPCMYVCARQESEPAVGQYTFIDATSDGRVSVSINGRVIYQSGA